MDDGLAKLTALALLALPSVASAWGYPTPGPIYFGSRTDYVEAWASTDSDGYGGVCPTFWDVGQYEAVVTAQAFVCGLAGVGGQFQSGADYSGRVAIYQGAPGRGEWCLDVSARKDFKFLSTDTGTAWGGIRCVPYTHFAGYDPASGEVHVYTAEAAANTWYRLASIRFVSTFMGFEGALDGGGEKPHVGPHSGNEFAHVRSQAAGQAAADTRWVRGTAYRWGEPPSGSYRAGRFHWSQYQQDATTRMIPIAQGICFLAGVSGKFRGYGEHVEVVARDDGYWHLTGASQQSEVQGWADCFSYDG
jgi:hypothetical protein